MRAQIALWMLTKFAMVFFIFALALVLMGLADRENQAICEAQAQSAALSIANGVVGVINSPVEDESKILSLEAALGAGKEAFQKYTVTLTQKESSNMGEIVVEVKTGGGCSGGARAPYDAGSDGIKVHFPPAVSPAVYPVKDLTPSDPVHRSRYLVLVKCQPKTMAGTSLLKKQFFLQDCKNPDVSGCMSLTSPNIAACCGWGNTDSGVVQTACDGVS